MITISVKSEFDKYAAFLDDRFKRQLPYATTQALNDTARLARDRVNAAMDEMFDRPTPFTRRAAVAPRELTATKTSLTAAVTLRPVQAKYLELQELGGARSPANNTRKAARALVLPAPAQGLDSYGNIPAGTLRKLRQRRAQGGTHDAGIAYLPAGARGNKGGIGGYFMRHAGGLVRLISFLSTASYKPRLGFNDRVMAVAEAEFPKRLAARLSAAIRTAR